MACWDRGDHFRTGPLGTGAMRAIFEVLLPARVDNTIRGMKLPFYVFALYALVSLIHLLAPDGGAGSIAGMDLSVAGALKPVTFAHTPPGAIGNQLVLPLAALMLGLAVWSALRPAPAIERR